MRVYTLIELFRLTRAELFGLHRETVQALAETPEESPERGVALNTLRDIARVLARPKFTPS